MPSSATSNATKPARKRAVRARTRRRNRGPDGICPAAPYGSLGRSKRLIMAALRVWELKNGIRDQVWARSGPAEAAGALGFSPHE